MQELLIKEAKILLPDLQMVCDNEGRYFAGLKIWVNASSHKKEIIDLSQNIQNVLKKLGATILPVDKKLGPTAWKQLDDADILLMFAETPGVSARALDILFNSRKDNTTVADKLYIYIPEEYSSGFICGRFNFYRAKVRPLDRSCFCKTKSPLFRACLNDMCDETLNKRRQETLRKTEFVPQIGIVTALGVEFKAVTRILKEPRLDPVREKGTPYQEYYHGIIESQYGSAHKVVVARCGKGNNKAAVLATSLIRQYPDIEAIFMVGVAAGVPNVKDATQHVRLGDIVVCNENGVIQYDMVKKSTGKTEHDPPPRPPSHDWLVRVENYIATMIKEPLYWSYLDEISKKDGIDRPHIAPLKDTPWVEGNRALRQPLFPGQDPKRPKIHIGPIASSNTVLKNATVREYLRKNFKIKAVEMEASGIAEAAWQNGKGYFVIRGICDFANDDKNKRWQPYAASAAAAFTREIIETMPVTEAKKKS